MTIRQIAATAVLASAVLSSYGSDEPRSESTSAVEGDTELRKLTVSVPVIGTSVTPVLLADERGIFERHGLDVELITLPSANVVAALRSGDTQFALTAGTEVLSAHAAEVPVVAVAHLGNTMGFQLYGRPGIDSAEDLRGQTIGTTGPGSATTFATNLALSELGLSIDDVDIVNFATYGDVQSALESGAIDAGVSTPPGSFALVRNGYTSVIDLTGVARSAVFAAAALPDYIDENPDIVAGFTAALVEGAELAVTDPRAVAQVVEDALEIAAEDVDGTVEFIASQTKSPPTAEAEDYALTQDALAAAIPEVASVDLTALVDTSFVETTQAPSTTLTS